MSVDISIPDRRHNCLFPILSRTYYTLVIYRVVFKTDVIFALNQSNQRMDLKFTVAGWVYHLTVCIHVRLPSILVLQTW